LFADCGDDLSNDVAPEAWLILSDWLEPKNHRGDSGLNENFHSDQNHRLYDTHDSGDSNGNDRGNACGDSREWGR